MIKKALIIGIDSYANNPLTCCVSDAESINKLLEENVDNQKNFDTKLLINDEVTKDILEIELENLFSDDADVVLLYFAGHGVTNKNDAYICTHDYSNRIPGYSMKEILDKANASKCKNKILIFDCCESGCLGHSKLSVPFVELATGVAIITSTKKHEKALAKNGHGIFSKLLIEALEGGAADTLGRIYLTRIFNYITQSLTAWHQRPSLKSNIEKENPVRIGKGKISVRVLKRITKIFLDVNTKIQLDPTFYDFRDGHNPMDIEPVEKNQEIFNTLLKMYFAGLIETDGFRTLFTAAKESSFCQLTFKGRYYFNLVKNKVI